MFKDFNVKVTHKYCETIFYSTEIGESFRIIDDCSNRQIYSYFNKDFYIINTFGDNEGINALDEFKNKIQSIMNDSIHRPMCNLLYKEIRNRIMILCRDFYLNKELVFELPFWCKDKYLKIEKYKYFDYV